MLKNILSLTKKLISIKSTFDSPKALEEILELSLLHLKGFTIEQFKKNGVKSILVYNSKTRPKKFKVLLNGHLDVVPGKDYRYIPEIKGNKLYGVGSMDMKASVACLIEVFSYVANQVNYPLGLQLVTDEEIGGYNGTKYQIEKGVRAEFIITGESTSFDIVNKAKGILQVKISAKGKTAHGAYPWAGENAIWKINEFLNALQKKYPIPSQEIWAMTVNVSKIETTNKVFNKIPDDCTAWLDVRFVLEEYNIVKKNLLRLLPKGLTLEIVNDEPALSTDENNEFIKLLTLKTKQVTGNNVRLRGANGSSDVRHFARINCAGIEFGPVGGNIGSDQEWVDIPSLEKYYQTLIIFLLDVDKNKLLL